MNTLRAPSALLAHFGSLHTTLVCMALLAVAALAGQVQGWPMGLMLGLVMGGLVINLLAALVAHPAFRRQLPLLVFHLALAALVLLVGLGRMTALDGRFELTQGVPYDGSLIESSAGRWHRDGLARLAFRHDGFEIDYAPGRKRGATRNPVAWVGDDGARHTAVIGDHRPLILDGYRFYTSPNKGYAPMLTWRPRQGEAVSGAVHLPSYPMHELRQSREWPLPNGREAWVMLQLDPALLDPNAHTVFRLPDAHTLVVRVGSQRAELVPGGRLELDDGTLVYDGLRTWMGYRVSYDGSLPWLLAASLLAALSLAWHYTERFFFADRSARKSRATRAAPVTGQGAGDV